MQNTHITNMATNKYNSHIFQLLIARLTITITIAIAIAIASNVFIQLIYSKQDQANYTTQLLLKTFAPKYS